MKTLTKNRLKLIFITTLFALPVLSAWFVYQNPQLLEGSKTKNYGELISPAIPSQIQNFVNQATEEGLQHLKGRWVLVHLDLDGRCDSGCIESVKLLHQLNILLNKDSDRLKRVFFDNGGSGSDAAQALFSQDGGLTVLPWTEEHIAKLKTLIAGLNDGDMILLDPLGNIMMKYQQQADPYGIQKDLKLLFKASQIG
ncbi:MAG: hypothetical protein KBT50_08795 [Cycloclasticus sp.]|nr:hypothetical protein [Cycloclasticus sp.]MBQ0790701.1 hypothetical protein [Cycloclasticus sp.]